MNKQTPLFTWHRSHGAKITSFAGWDMPLQYHTGPIQEPRLLLTFAAGKKSPAL
ncbi:MAG: hypothetical protein EA383_14370 [Spirochaetaceae bacterium]|nr:MAG: hypothetical protein EA383_14370 [Spirochaetaceae bacterium]